MSTSIELTQKNYSVTNIMVCLIICCAVHFYFCEKYGRLFRNGEWYFFFILPYICKGDSAQRIFVKACAWLCPFQESYLLPRKVQCMKKSYMKGRKKGGWFLLGSLPKSMRYCELWMGVISYSNWVMRYCILNQPTKRTATMYVSVYNINTYMYIMSGILKNPFQ